MIESLEDLNENILIPAFQNAIHSCRFEIVEWNRKVRKYADSAKSRFAFRKQLSDSNIKLKSLLEEYAKIKPARTETTDFDILQETNKRVLLEWNAKKARCSEELLLIVEDMKSYLSYYTTLIASLKSKKDFTPDSESENDYEYIDQSPISRSGIVFAEEQLRKGLEHFSDILPAETIESFKEGGNQAGGSLEEVDDVDVDEYSDADDSAEDNGTSDEDGEGENGEGDSEIDLDYYILRSVGLEIMGTVEEEDCHTGENFVILPSHLSQSTLGGRNGSSACTVISLITGRFLNEKDRISLKESLPVYIGCIEAGNNLHEGSEFLLIEEAAQLLPFTATLNKELNCYKKDVETHVLQLLQEAKAIVLISNNSSVCLLKLSNQKIFLFDSHRHNKMGALIAWTENDLKDILPFIPCRSSNDLIYIASIVYD